MVVNPGFCYGSELHRQATGVFGVIVGVVKRVIEYSTPIGARTLAHAAVAESFKSYMKHLSDERTVVFADYVHTEQSLAMRKKSMIRYDGVIPGRRRCGENHAR